MLYKRILLSLFLLLGVFSSTWAAEFVIKAIDVQGLQRIEVGTVYNAIPVSVGDTFDTDTESADLVRIIYQTGHFSHVEVDRAGNTLIIRVKERPVIGKIEVTGNEDIDTEDLLEALKTVGIAEGYAYD